MSETTGTTQIAAETNPQETNQETPQQERGIATSGAQATGGNLAKEAAQEAMRKLKISYGDGKEEEVPEDEVLKIYKERKGHQREANRLLQEGKRARKEAEQFVEMMKDKTKLFEVIQKLGHDPRKLTEEYLAEQLKYEMMDPVQRELLEKDRKLKEYEAREQAEKERQRQETEKMAQAKYAKEYSEQIIEALKTSALPQNKESVKKIASYIAKYAKYKIPISAQEAAKLAEEDFRTIQNSVYKDATPEQLVKLFGEDWLQKLRTYDASRVKSPEDNLKTPAEQGELAPRKKAVQRMTHQEWRAFNRAR